MVDFLRQHGDAGLATLRVAFRPPTLPPYYGPRMDLSVEIDRGDVWYDFPFDARGRLVEQTRSLGICSAEIRGADGKLHAMASATLMVKAG